ncbi:helix-turn-helix domain-containing protein [Desulfotomaculum sp. 1211_IL3151]|uniref:helix-turn-helix domain-containing protein n=1 Tax=Desulfotomaculum sp. 1211_IL3151 TaxID=3084055 RepID=UPI002FD98527
MIGKRIKKLRTTKELTQAELAKHLEVTTSSVGMYESGTRNPSYEVMVKLANFFNVSVDYLLGKSPFKNAQEEQYSIMIAAIKAVIHREDTHDLFWDTAMELLHSTSHIYTPNTLLYLSHILDKLKRPVTAVEYYDLCLFVSNGFKWPTDYQGPVIVKIKNEEIPILLDYWKIEKVTLDESTSRITYIETNSQISSECKGSNDSDKTTLNKSKITEPNHTDTYRLSQIPVVGVIRAGEPLFAQQNIISYEYLPEQLTKSGEYFGLKVTGDSMNLSRINDGDIVIVRQQPTVENGEIAVVLVNGEDATIKKFYCSESTVTLLPNSTNQDHQPRFIDLAETEVKVLGKVIKVIVNL